jgi:hypothetical protein
MQEPSTYGWTPEQLEMLEQVRAWTPEERAAALKATRESFTPAERAEIRRRQHESAKVIDRLAATETLEEQEQLADELCPRFDSWIAGRNKIQSVRRTRTRPLAVRAPRRTHQSSGRPRAAAARSSARAATAATLT